MAVGFAHGPDRDGLLMKGFFEGFIALRYLRVWQYDHFISFISLISMFGVALGVMALIVVMSVMNGFEKELRERTLGMTAHAVLHSTEEGLRDWQGVVRRLIRHPQVSAAAPFIHAEGMLSNGGRAQGTIIRGILPRREAGVSRVASHVVLGSLTELRSEGFGIALGTELARVLGVTVGDRVMLVSSQLNIGPAGLLPRLKRFTVVALFEVGMHEYDSALALIHMDDACLLLRCVAPGNIRIQTVDLMRAPAIVGELRQELGEDYWFSDWTASNRNLLRALKIEKTVMFVILSLIVAVAAFNIVSTLVMTVTEKRSDIAILRTMGASSGSILLLFVMQGTLIGLLGGAMGLFAGVLLATNISTLVPTLEALLDTEFMPADIYYISQVPSELYWPDVYLVSLMAFLICVLATLYPALRAAQTRPAQALRHE